MAEGRTLIADHSPLTTMHCPLPFEDSRLRLIYDGRWSICEVPPLWRLTHVLFKVRNGALTPRDVKNEDRSGYVHENTGEGTKCTPKKRPFYTKMHPLHDNRQELVRLVGRKCKNYAINRGEGGPKIGSSAHRPIDPSEEHGVGFRWPDDPMVRWPDRAALQDVDEKKYSYVSGAR